MEEPEEEAPLVVDAGEVTPLWTGPSGGTARLLLTNPRPSPVEVWRWILHPGERYESNPHPAGVTETLTVIRGRMTFTAGGGSQRLRGGETAVFAADVAHSYEGSGRGPCELLMTVHIPLEHHNG
jgi:quercetin dioxygenase-like cupin family protein